MNLESAPKIEMKPEEVPVQQEEIRISMSGEELNSINTLPTDSEELHLWMKEKGVEFDTGEILVLVDGVKHYFLTEKADFATIVDIEE